MDYNNQSQSAGYAVDTAFDRQQGAKAYIGQADRVQDKPTELDQIGNRIAAAINESCLAIEMLSSIEDKLFGPRPVEKANESVRPVPNGAISQLNMSIDVLGGKQAIIAKSIQRIRTAI